VTLDDLCAVVALQLGQRGVDPDARLVEDLGADSMDLVAVLATIEERWGVGLDETTFAEVTTLRELAAHVAAEAARQP
jgi:acyl carrier protein